MKAKAEALRAAEEKRLEAAVAWKVFEVQAVLVGGTGKDEQVSEKGLALGRLWLQPWHYQEIVKERAVNGRCGYPVCNEEIVMGAGDDQQVYRINRKTRSLEDGSESCYYCTGTEGQCLMRSQAYRSSLDDSMPAAREIAKSLDMSKIPARVDQVLETLNFHDGSDSDGDDAAAAATRLSEEPLKKSSAQKFRATSNPRSIPNSPTRSIASSVGDIDGESGASEERAPPPQYTHSQMFQSGAVKSTFWGVKNSKAVDLENTTHSIVSVVSGSSVSFVAEADPSSARGLTNLSLLPKQGAEGSILDSVKRSSSSIRAAELLNSLRSDPTKLGIVLPGSGQLSPVKRGKEGGKNASESSGSRRSPITDSDSKYSNSPMNLSRATDITDAKEPDADPSAHPSLQEVMAPPSNIIELDPSKIKEMKPSAREMPMRDKYKAGGAMQMQMMGSAPVTRRPKPDSLAQQEKKKKEKESAEGKAAAGEDDEEKEEELDEETAAKLQKMEEEDAAKEAAEYDARLNAGSGYGSWREDRLNTKQSQPSGGASEETIAILLEAKPSVAPRVRMNPKGARAQALAKSPEKVRTDPIVLAEDASEEERRFIAGINDEGDKPKAYYNNGIVGGKVREVEWKDPDPALLKDRLKPVTKRVAPNVIDTMSTKRSLFREQRESQRLRERGAASSTASQLDHSAGAKTVSWNISETVDPVTMPESSITTKHGDDYQYTESARSKLNRELLEEEALNDGTRDEEFCIPEDPAKRELREQALLREDLERVKNENLLQYNRDVRKAFFSSTGISAMVIPEGFSKSQVNMFLPPGAGAGGSGQKMKKKKKKSPKKGIVIGEDVELEMGDEEVEHVIKQEMTLEDVEGADSSESESESEEEEDDGTFSDSSDEPEPASTPAKPSSFFVLWTALDDLLTHTATVIKRRANSVAGAMIGRSDAKEAKVSVDIEYERNNTIQLANPDRVTSAQGSKQTILFMFNRGIASSELALQLNSRLHPTQLVEYYYTKKRTLGVIDANQACPPLTSSGWALLGLLLIDGIVRMRQLYSSVDNPELTSAEAEWGNRVRKLVPMRAEGVAAKDGVVQVDAHELRVLRSFFDDL